MVTCSALSTRTAPTFMAAVATRPVEIPAPSSTAVARNEVVVFPSVPVTPTIPSDWPGSPYHQPAATASARRLSSTRSWVSDMGRSLSTIAAQAPRPAAAAANSCPSAWTPGTATKTLPPPVLRESKAIPLTGANATASWAGSPVVGLGAGGLWAADRAVPAATSKSPGV